MVYVERDHEFKAQGRVHDAVQAFDVGTEIKDQFATDIDIYIKSSDSIDSIRNAISSFLITRGNT